MDDTLSKTLNNTENGFCCGKAVEGEKTDASKLLNVEELLTFEMMEKHVGRKLSPLTVPTNTPLGRFGFNFMSRKITALNRWYVCVCARMLFNPLDAK